MINIEIPYAKDDELLFYPLEKYKSFSKSRMNCFKQFISVLFLFLHIRPPPFLTFLQKKEEKNMKNDYKRTDFKEVKENNNVHYFIRIQGYWIEIPLEVFKVYKTSYKKIYYENKRDYDKVFYFENIDLAVPYLKDWSNDNYIEQIYHQDFVKKLDYAISTLSKEEQMLVHDIYFEEMTEQQLAKKLHMTQQNINYKKQKILKKLKTLLLNAD